MGFPAAVYTLMVDNEFGVLTRITARIRREGWNIRSLSVNESTHPERSRLTMAVEYRHSQPDHVARMLSRMDCVHQVREYNPNTQVIREMGLIRIWGEGGKEGAALLKDHGAALVKDACGGGLYQVCDLPENIDNLVARLLQLCQAEVARTGAVALENGAEEEGL